MKKPKRNWHLTLVDVLVGLAVLMILSALVVPVFVPPNGRAASRVATSHASAKPAQH
jgi:type II secretory pathway pseudopilin PulG